MYDNVYDMTPEGSGLRIPLQAAPIDRSAAGAAAFGRQAGVDASGWLDDVVGAATTYGPGIVKGLGAFGI